MDRSGLGLWLIVTGILLLTGVGILGPLLAPPIGHSSGNVSMNVLVGHQQGNVVEYGPSGGVRWEYGNASGYLDVTLSSDGIVLAAFYQMDVDQCSSYSTPCTRTGFRAIQPGHSPSVRTEWTFPVRTSKDSEVHDVELLPGGDVVMVDMDRERLLRVDPETGRVHWQWNASEYYSPPDDPTTVDWLHMNDVDRIDEGRYLVSVRNANQLLVVEETTGVVDVVNEDGDPELFRRQHNPHWLGEGRILLADSENDRVVEIARRGDDWQIVWSLASADEMDFDWPRDADRLPSGNTLITDSRNNRVVLVNESGDTLASVKTDNLPYEADAAPFGERAGGLIWNTAPTVPELRSDDVPVLTTIEHSARHVIPLPHWVSEEHVLCVLLGTFLVLVGATVSLRTRFRF